MAAIIIAALLAWLFSWLTFINYHYELTDQGFRKESGVIWKRYITIPYSRIQNVDIHRGVFARLLGSSDIQIHTACHNTNTAVSEGRLPALSEADAETMRDELVRRITKPVGHQGL